MSRPSSPPSPWPTDMFRVPPDLPRIALGPIARHVRPVKEAAEAVVNAVFLEGAAHGFHIGYDAGHAVGLVVGIAVGSVLTAVSCGLVVFLALVLARKRS